jgi:transporter family-2 protein
VDRGTAVILTAIGGGLIALQAPINSHLGKAIGTFQAALLSFVIGTLALGVIAALAKGGLGQIADARHLSWYWFLGGLLGAVYVTTVLVTVRTLGAGGVTAATISAQLTMSVIVDRFGLLGVEKTPITIGRIAGIALLAAGVFLVVRE